MPDSTPHADILLVGGGIMSATLGVLLHERFPDKHIVILERLDKVAEESSEAWNNAGTGHAGNCELNYTPIIDGTVDTTKAEKTNAQFQRSLQFWQHCAAEGCLSDLDACLHQLPHMSFVQGKENVQFLEQRWQTMRGLDPFSEMQYSSDTDQIREWIPLMMQGRDLDQPIAVTRIDSGYDVNFGAITDQLFAYLAALPTVELKICEEVQDLKKENGKWTVEIENIARKEHWSMTADFVFLGAGGGALPLLEKSKIPEGDGYGGFPVSGMWLRCLNPDIILQHDAKVYGKADQGSPPMSVPHLDTRYIDGQRQLLYGPYAGFSTKFLKYGSYFDLPTSIELDNLPSLIGAGIHNLPLTGYLIRQVTQSFADRMEMLRRFYPQARDEDWELAIAGQRVQIIKPDEEDMGKLQFGTEIISSADRSLSALLGASPGASTSYAIMQEVMDECFPL